MKRSTWIAGLIVLAFLLLWQASVWLFNAALFVASSRSGCFNPGNECSTVCLSHPGDIG